MAKKTENQKVEVKKEVVKKEKKISKVNEQKVTENKNISIQEIKKPHVSKRQFGKNSKKATLAVKARQTRWAPVWAVVKKFGTGKRVHPSAITAYKRNWRRTKLHIKPRRIKKWHLG